MKYPKRKKQGMTLTIAEWKYAFHALTGRKMDRNATSWAEAETLYKEHGETAIRASLKDFDVNIYLTPGGYPNI